MLRLNAQSCLMLNIFCFIASQVGAFIQNNSTFIAGVIVGAHACTGQPAAPTGPI